MDISVGKTNKGKNIVVSILWGIRYAVTGLIVGTFTSAIALYLISPIIGLCNIPYGDCGESNLLILMIFSVIGGMLISVVSGIIGARRIYKRLSKEL